MDAFQSFSKTLKTLKDLPLSIQAILPASDSLTYTSVFVPQPCPSMSRLLEGYRPYTCPIDVVIQFESSNRLFFMTLTGFDC
jgi:hypothetical protein